MRKMSEVKENIHNLLSRKVFLSELKMNEDFMMRFLQDTKENGKTLDGMKLTLLDPDEKVCGFNDFIRNKKK